MQFFRWLPAHLFPSPALPGPEHTCASELSMSLLGSLQVPQMQMCAVLGVSMCIDEHMCSWCT